MKNMIKAVGLTKAYGPILAIDHISFRVERGEFFGFLGPNGAGKTTTIRILTCVIKPDSGIASIMGYDLQGNPLNAKQVMGILPEMANAYVDLTAWQNLMFVGEVYGVPKPFRRKLATMFLKKVGLYERRDQLVKAFSRGMKQRLLVCMALLNEPEILFLDEPTSGLDVQSARLIRGMLRELNKNGVTIFLTTHNMEEADQLCDRVAIINHGRIISVDKPEDLRSRMTELQSIEVAFHRPISVKSLAKLSSVAQIKKLNGKIRLYTGDLNTLIHQIVEYSRNKRLRFTVLNTMSPSLEEVFIKLVEGEKEG